MKKIILTADYYIGTPIEIGTMQKIMWGGQELEVTSQETGSEIQICLNLMGWRKAVLDDLNDKKLDILPNTL